MPELKVEEPLDQRPIAGPNHRLSDHTKVGVKVWRMLKLFAMKPEFE